MVASPSLPVRVYEAGEKIMIAVPMAARRPEEIAVTVDGERVRVDAWRVRRPVLRPMMTREHRCDTHVT